MIEKLGITKGPWFYDGDGYVMGYHHIICGGEHHEGYMYYDKDTMLICAAPEMLEALIDTVLIIEGSPSVIIGSIEYELRNAYIPIIEKATGKTWSEIKDLI